MQKSHQGPSRMKKVREEERERHGSHPFEKFLQSLGVRSCLLEQRLAFIAMEAQMMLSQ